MTNYNEMINDIKIILNKNSHSYFPVDSKLLIKLIHKLYKYDIYEFDDNKIDDIEQLYIGSYYMIKEEYTKAVKYYKMAVNKGNSAAIYNLACYYEDIEENYTEAIKYYKMAIDNGNSFAMYNLALHYKNTEKNYTEAIKYYKMAIDNGNSFAMYNLALHYETIEKNYTEAIKYYKMAIDKGDPNAMSNLAYYYETIEKNYTEAIKYYRMTVDKGNTENIDKLIKLYELNKTPGSINILNEYIIFLNEHQSQIPNFDKLLKENISKLFAEYNQISNQIRKILYNYQFEDDIILNLKLDIYLTTNVIPKKILKNIFAII